MAEKMDTGPKHQELLALIVEEVDPAREVLELASQLVHALPLRSFEDVVKAAGGSGSLRFRGRSVGVHGFVEAVPEIIFPIDTEQKLVTLLYETVRRAPPWFRSESDTGAASRRLRRLGILGVQQGVLGQVPGPSGLSRAATSQKP
jgi:hypothetical protein